MAKEAENVGRRGAVPWRILGWGLAALLLLLPLAANAPWTASDFLFAGGLMAGVGLVFELTVRMSRSHAYRAGVAFALAAAFLIVWANGAVGMIGDEDNPYNLFFLGVIGLALAGAAIVGFRAAGMALAMAIAGVAQIVLAAVGMSTDLRGGVVSAILAGAWLVSATLFQKAAWDQRQAAPAPPA